MNLIEEALDEENEKILQKLDDTLGLNKTKNVLRNIIRYHKVIQKYDCNIEFKNYNIIIRNNSNYSIYEELINVIAKIYYKNGIIKNPNILYINRDDVRPSVSKKNTKESKIYKEGLIVIDIDNLPRNPFEMRKEIQNMIKFMPGKAFIILEDDYMEGKVNATLNEYFAWSMKINTISGDDKENYIRKFMTSNNLICDKEIIKELADNPYYVIKNDMINLLVNCKIKKENDVSKLLKKEDIKKEGAEKNKTGLQELEELIRIR